MRIKNYRRIDTSLAAAIFGLSVFGLLMLYSASAELSRTRTGDLGNSTYFLILQLVPFVIGLVAWIVLQNIDYKIYGKWKVYWLVATVVLLMSVFLFSKGQINGANRWVSIGGISLQPSEIAKLTFIMFLGSWFSDSHRTISEWKRGFLPFVLIICVMSAFMLWQHDLGTLSVMLVIALVMYVVSGAKLAQIGAIILGLGGVAWLAIKLEPYRMKRLLTFLNSDAVSTGANYHINQAKISIGLGSWWGKGFLQGTQKKGFLPEAHTDSIFAVVVEELGFMRAILVILVYVFIVIRGFRIARFAPDRFGALIAVGITTWFASQTLINMSAMVSLVPLTGVPLPFISYGRTAMVALFMATGILLNISRVSKPGDGALNV